MNIEESTSIANEENLKKENALNDENKVINEVEVKESIIKNSSNWVIKLKKRILFSRIICVSFFIIFLILTITLFLVGITNKSNYYLITGLILLCLSEIFFVMSIFSFISQKFSYKVINGYIIGVYCWLKKYLIVDGNIEDVEKYSWYLYGKLPNGKKIAAKISHITLDINIGFDNE